MKTILLGIAAWGAAAVLALGAPEEQDVESDVVGLARMLDVKRLKGMK